MIVYGVTDAAGKFHPVSFMISSHETEEDFKIFFDDLFSEAESLDVSYEPEFVMQDTCPASKKAIQAHFNVKILMCYFHVKKNVLEHKNLLRDKNKYKDIMKDLTSNYYIFILYESLSSLIIKKAIHLSINENECKKNKSTFRKKYSSTEPEMYEYCATWFVAEWSNWMSFYSKPGLANTNSNIESFNAVLKRDYFERRKVPMRTALTKLIECIVCIVIQQNSVNLNSYLK